MSWARPGAAKYPCPWVGAIAAVGIGGAMDVVFKGGTAYVLVTLVGPDVGGSSVVGIYRVDGPSTFTVIADIGAFALAHPPATDFFVPTGVQYAIERFRNGFLVTDGHHNRVYRVTLDGTVRELIASATSCRPASRSGMARSSWRRPDRFRTCPATAGS